MRFRFIGKMAFNSADSSKPFIRKGKTKSGADYLSLNGSVVAETNNRAFVETFGMKTSTIKTLNTDSDKIEVKWDNRFDEDVVNQVANFRKFVIKLNDERHTFITEYDFIKFIQDNVEDIKDKRFQVTGQSQINEYEGNISFRFKIQNMYEVAEDVKNGLRVDINETWTADDVDLDDWKEEKKIYINGFTREYVNPDVKNKYVPVQVLLDASKIDFDNERNVSLLKFNLKQLGIELVDENKVKCTLKNKKVYSLALITNYINGAEQVEISEDMLTDNQKEAIALGLNKLEDFADGKAYGERVTIFKIKNFNLKGDSADGVYDTELTLDEFEDEKYTPKKKETETDMFELDDDDEDDLFG